MSNQIDRVLAQLRWMLGTAVVLEIMTLAATFAVLYRLAERE
ncbi:hypothetical protein LuPra_03764 [Luteitalea pratensis]|uniref:Uncharacterized protein n=1 Tax=Luteitalea pratensis TaxID=1855912 RepID=A0A143PQX3_LUTPR|nr:hypothetical protein [Luteitalea pratensis]AMY10528.1 hypothetical protein LuPra_03764 [Luteitalea pratensis]